MFCTQCGTKLAEGAAFCHECGARVIAPTDTEAGEQATETPTPTRAEQTDATRNGAAPSVEMGVPRAVGGAATAAEAEPPQTCHETCWIRHHTYLWSSPDEPGDRKFVRKGSRVDVKEQLGSKVRVSMEDGSHGWLYSGVLSQRPIASDPPTAEAAIVAQTFGEKSYLRRDVAERVAQTSGAGRYTRPNTFPQDSARQVSATGAGAFGRILFLLGGIGVSLCPFLPWVSVFGVNVSLYDAAEMIGDSSGFVEVIVIGIATAIGGLLRVFRGISLGWARAWGIIGGAAGLIEFIIRYSRFNGSLASEFGLASLEIGFWLLGIASVVAVVGVLIDREDAPA